MRLGEGVSLPGSLDPNWGHQGRGVCGGSKQHGGVIEEIGCDWLPNWEKKGIKSEINKKKIYQL